MIRPTTFLHIAFIIVLYWVGVVYQAFLLDMVIAGLLSIATSRTHGVLIARSHSMLAASLILTVLLAISLFGPLLYFIVHAAQLLQSVDFTFFEKIRTMLTQATAQLEAVPPSYRIIATDYLHSIKYEDYVEKSMGILQELGQGGLKFFSNMAIILVFYFFANLYGQYILAFFKRLLPLKGEDTQMIFDEMSQIMSVVMYSTLFNAILQGFLFALVAAYLGYDPIFLGTAFSLASLVPVVGGMLMWLPIALYEMSQGSFQNALIVSVYTIVVISVVADTFIKPVIIDAINRHFVRRPTNINSLIIFFAILAGISTYGFWGIILGPAVTALFISLLKIYDYLRSSEESPPTQRL